MKKTILACLALSVAAAVSAQPLTPEQTLNRRTIGELEFSPDGSRLVFTVTEPPKAATRQRSLWLLDAASGRVRRLTDAPGKTDSSPRWAPDGQWIAFTSDRDGTTRLYVLPMRGGEAEPIVDRKESVGTFRWSPDGRQIAFLMAEPKPAALERREKEKDDGRVVDKDDRHPRLWVVDVQSRVVRQVTSGKWRIGQIEWLPSGDRLIASATDRPEADQWTQRIFTVAVSDGRFTELAAPRGPFNGLDVSPDGRTLAYVGARIDGPEAHDVWLAPTSGGPTQNLTSTTIDRPVSQPRWIDDRTLFAGVARGFTSGLVTIGRDGRLQPIDSVGTDEVNATQFARASNGTIAFVGERATRAPEVWLQAPNAPPKKVTTFNEQWASIPLIAPEFVKYKSFDGVEIEAALLLPHSDAGSGGSRTSARVPLIVLIHGGPTGRWSDTFEPWGQLFVSRGYAVLYPNIRGSTGYGQRFVEMNRADWGGGDFKDVMAGVDAVIARGVADADRLAIGGWSYGGYMAAWAVTQTARFKAAVSGAPVTDLASEYGTEAGAAYDEWFFGVPYERDRLDGFIKSSPITYVKNAKTPTLLLQGENDVTDPIGQSQQFYRGLKRYGVDADLVLYPREGHGLREEKHLLDRLNRVIAWYDKHVKPESRTSSSEPRAPR
jgi:dipeptidyl aminopeptidase/acylaminoacyl peptidase